MFGSLAISVTQGMPKAFEILFFCTGTVFFFAEAFRMHAARQRWKSQESSAGKRYKMSRQERIEFGLYNLGGLMGWALGWSDWWMRATFGTFSLILVVGLLYQLDFKVLDAPVYDEASTLQIHS